jgi:linoleoyl-CoA desaturase
MQSIQFIEKDKNRIAFFSILRLRVEQYFKENNISKHFNSKMVFKTIFLLVVYLVPYTLILFIHLSPTITYALWFLMGLSKAGIGMSVMHDANHGAYSKSRKTNYWLGLTLNLVGGSVFNWKMQHNTMHHTYTNIIDLDDDIEDKLILRFSPHTKVKWYHKFQFIYAFFFYGILTLYWALIKDFVQFRKYIKTGVNKESAIKNRIFFTKILVFKLIYFFVFIVAPIFIIKLSALDHILGFLLMHFVAGIILTIIFQLAHTVERTTHPLPNAEGTIENNWAIHQLNTTVNFSRKNWFLTWYLGGLNFQVEHHLFPNICHIHYPNIAPIVKKTAEEFDIPYLENESFYKAVKSHIKMLKVYGE